MALNIGGGSRITVHDLLRTLQEVMACRAHLAHLGGQKGDVGHTAADWSLARRAIGFSPCTPLAEGLRRQAAWQLDAQRWLAAVG
jgi:UDP-glucose 4-epimerase